MSTVRSVLGGLALLVSLLLVPPAAAQFGGPPQAGIPVTCTNPTRTAFVDCGGGGGGAGAGTAETDDTAFTGGATSVTPAGALYDTTPPSIDDGHVGIPRMSAERYLFSIFPVPQHIICDSGCGGPSVFADEDPFTPGTTSLTLTGYVVDETSPDSAAEDTGAAPRMAPNRIPYSILRDAAGNERGANVDAANRLTTIAAQGGTWSTGRTWTLSSGTDSVAVTGPLTDAELRAAPVDVDGSGVTQPISAAALPLPTGAATEATLATLNGKVTAVDTGAVTIAALPNEGQQTMANSVSVAIASNQSAVPVSGTVTVTDGSGPLTVDGTITANAGTNLNTSALALEAGGNLAAAAASLSVVDDWDESDRAKVNPVVGQAGVEAGSGTVTNKTQRMVLATDVALPAGTNTLGNVGALPVTAGGTSVSRTVAAASTNATNVKASAGQVYQIIAANTNASARWVHLYNTAGTPTCNASIVASFIVPGASAGAGTNITLNPGVAFGTGIGVCITTGADGTGSVSASDVVLNVVYK